MVTDQLTRHINKRSFTADHFQHFLQRELIYGASMIEALIIIFYIFVGANQTFKSTDIEGSPYRILESGLVFMSSWEHEFSMVV